jgi:hypothetical protein
MFGSQVVACCAYIFYEIGKMEHGRGALLCVISVIVSLASAHMIPLRLPFVSVLIGQLFLFGALWIYNSIRKKPLD